jgi:hypothetical protein
MRYFLDPVLNSRTELAPPIELSSGIWRRCPLYLPSGTHVANIRPGEKRHQDPEGKPQQQTNWYNPSFYDDPSRVAMTFDKGDNIFVEGTIEQMNRKCSSGVSIARDVK